MLADLKDEVRSGRAAEELIKVRSNKDSERAHMRRWGYRHYRSNSRGSVVLRGMSNNSMDQRELAVRIGSIGV